MKIIIAASILSAAVISACNSSQSLKGKWNYAGGIYNGKKEGSTQGYLLKRTYTDKDFEAFMIEDGGQPQKYQAGNYKLKGDSCTETETFNTQPSTLTGVNVNYSYQLKNDSLILRGKLPTGMQVEEYWIKEE
ncbi:hypothetical protein [uncultured Mucilaginibacter sp.]|uniref:hypothetical protein n=1 Tax=uncultured Mucilaginibacter sp. TaxID=797541 RepID=UPI0025FE79AF|nr:hypothetical protein [uncultured Mucilaginibacter sp.]